MVHVIQPGLKAIPQNIDDVGAHMLVTWSACQVRHDFGERVAAPGHSRTVADGAPAGKPPCGKLCTWRPDRLRWFMTSQRLGRQPDLFAPPSDLFDPQPEEEAPPADFVERIRKELRDTLALTTAANALPWSDLTTAILKEKRFHSIASWLPGAEAAQLRAAFATQLDRLYGPDEPAV